MVPVKSTMAVQLHTLASRTDGVKLSPSRSGPFIPGEIGWSTYWVSPGAGLYTAANMKLRNHTAALHYVTIHIRISLLRAKYFGCMSYVQILYFLRNYNDFNYPIFLSRPVRYSKRYIICSLFVVSPSITFLKLVLLKCQRTPKDKTHSTEHCCLHSQMSHLLFKYQHFSSRFISKWNSFRINHTHIF
jgi:hypothetical protein